MIIKKKYCSWLDKFKIGSKFKYRYYNNVFKVKEIYGYFNCVNQFIINVKSEIIQGMTFGEKIRYYNILCISKEDKIIQKDYFTFI